MKSNNANNVLHLLCSSYSARPIKRMLIRGKRRGAGKKGGRERKEEGVERRKKEKERRKEGKGGRERENEEKNSTEYIHEGRK